MWATGYADPTLGKVSFRLVQAAQMYRCLLRNSGSSHACKASLSIPRGVIHTEDCADLA